MNSLQLLQELVSVPGPPGQEGLVRDKLAGHLDKLGFPHSTDAKGNLIVRLGKASGSKVVVTAHMDEIALFVRQINADGTLKVAPLGGIFPWKLGEGPVTIMASSGSFEAILGIGSIHTESNLSHAKRAKSEVLVWEMATVTTGLTKDELKKRGVRLGTRVVVSPSRRTLTYFGDFVSGYFLDDRADLVSWLLALEALKGTSLDVTFVATTSEEVGGEGAMYFLTSEQPDICIALELAPQVPDAPIIIDARPTVWVKDAYAAMPPHLGDLLDKVSSESGIELQFQALSRGGSDASCSAAKGLCAHPITLGLPMENSHGYEIIHKDSMNRLADFTVALVKHLAG
jgi:putative aminopeptidase FrvX